MGEKIRAILFPAWTVAVGISVARANEQSASPRTQGTLFAAMSLTKVSFVPLSPMYSLATEDGTYLTPCPIQVEFFGAGSMIGKATVVQLRAGESTSVLASRPPKLV
jgi:hypothetical protein